MAKRRIYDLKQYVHYITFSCYRRRKLLQLDRCKRIVLGVLNRELKSHNADCLGFVLMLNHVHILLKFADDGHMSSCVQEWKQSSSVHVKNVLFDELAHIERPYSREEPIWQSKYYPFEIYSQRKLEEKLNYIHRNPVRAGLVKRPSDWPWSSARWYEFKQSVGIPIRSINS